MWGAEPDQPAGLTGWVEATPEDDESVEGSVDARGVVGA